MLDYKKRWLLLIPVIIFIICAIFADNFNEALRDPFTTKDVYVMNDHQDNLFIYNVIYRDTGSLAKVLKDLYPDLVIAMEEEAKQIVIKTSEENFLRLFRQLRQLDRALDQILIEVKVVELSDSALKNLGISWQYQKEGVSISESKSAEDFVERIDFLIASGKANIMAQPRVTTLIGKEALIHIGDKIPYSVPVESASGSTSWVVKYLDAGINLNILPQKAERGLISLRLQPEVASIKQWKQTAAGEYPIISARKVETFIRLKSGESFMIGGLINEEERENFRKVPFLGDIPILDILFSHKTYDKTKSDVVFMVTAQRV